MKETNIKFWETKRGTLIWIKEGNKKAKTWKLDGRIPIDVYVKYYRTKKQTPRGISIFKKAYLEQKKGKEYESIKRYTKQLEKKGRLIGKQIQPGITKTSLDLLKAGPGDIKKAYTQLLEPLVLDKGLLDIVIKNAYKFKYRFQYKTTIRNKDGEELAIIQETGRTIEEVIEEYRHKIKEGTVISSQNFESNIMPYLKRRNTDINGKKLAEGLTNKAETEIVFRRG